MNAHATMPDHLPALVLNADFRPLSYYPLSLWSWQETVKAVFLERVNIVSEYDNLVHSPTIEMKVPQRCFSEDLRETRAVPGIHPLQPLPSGPFYLSVLW